MKAFLRPWLLATLIGAGLPLVAQADVWGYVDDQGMTHFAESQLDSRYKLYFKNENFDFDPRKSALAQKQQRRPGPAGSGLTFNPSADAAAGNKAIRLVSQINRSRSYSQVSRHIQREASRNGLDYNLVKAVIAAESGFNAGAVSPVGAVGLMQIMPTTAMDLGLRADAQYSVEDKLTDPALNIRLGARYLKFLVNKYPGRLDLAVAAYNAGHGAVSRAGNQIPRYRETQNYVRTVMALYDTLSPGRGSQPAAARAMPLGKAQAGAGRVSMSIPASARVATPKAAAEPAVVQRLRDQNRMTVLLEPPTGTSPSALDTVSTKIAEADREATRLGSDVVVQPASLAQP
ncbi:lytic transglycosylase domain-containing protein [Brachymonas chironomi]|uniref:lytic transglycosylase domain-containing protein n=1 Tax=Brachymonas chironomi TaxID=491919 RepID=UPI00037934B4|nr:lytic transglycosylase domain-containing protein [Brachymonas chironomi]